MNAFKICQEIERQAMRELEPFFHRYSYRGQFLVVDKGPLAKFLQNTVGDVIMRSREDRNLYAIEVKAEQRTTGNLFLETWSNKPQKEGDMERRGWLYTLEEPNALLYYFLDTKSLYVIPFKRLRHWAIVNNRIADYREVQQGAWSQRNRTFGAIVPVVAIGAAVGFRKYHGPLFGEEHAIDALPPSQLPMFAVEVRKAGIGIP